MGIIFGIVVGVWIVCSLTTASCLGATEQMVRKTFCPNINCKTLGSLHVLDSWNVISLNQFRTNKEHQSRLPTYMHQSAKTETVMWHSMVFSRQNYSKFEIVIDLGIWPSPAFLPKCILLVVHNAQNWYFVVLVMEGPCSQWLASRKQAGHIVATSDAGWWREFCKCKHATSQNHHINHIQLQFSSPNQTEILYCRLSRLNCNLLVALLGCTKKNKATNGCSSRCWWWIFVFLVPKRWLE